MPNNNSAPDMGDEFNEASQSNSESQSTAEESERKIVTAAERDRHLDELAKLQKERHYTIDGTTEEEVHTDEQDEVRAKVQEMNERLGSAQKNFRKNFRSSC